MNYTHLTRDERYQIAILLKAGHMQSDIARILNDTRLPSAASLVETGAARLSAEAGA